MLYLDHSAVRQEPVWDPWASLRAAPPQALCQAIESGELTTLLTNHLVSIADRFAKENAGRLTWIRPVPGAAAPEILRLVNEFERLNRLDNPGVDSRLSDPP